MSEEKIEPLSEEELAALPVFPLPRVAFFPGSLLPLHFFEERYRALMEECVSSGPKAMAVALLRPGWEDDYHGRPPIHEIAGAGRIVDWKRRPDGRFDVMLQGLCRVRLSELAEDGRLFRRARATPLPDRISHPEALEALVPDVLRTAQAISALIRQRHPELTLGVDASTPPGALADRLADRLVADPERRQALIEQPDVKVRLALLQEALLDVLATLGRSGGALH